MTVRVLVIGGYGNFGQFIVRRLVKESDITVIVGGRSGKKAKEFVEPLKAGWIELDIYGDLDAALDAVKPHIVIHTSGPFQGQDYGVAAACIRHQAHYIDIADARAFVTGITALEHAANTAGVLAVSGASSVPALTSAIVDKYREEFRTLDSLNYGITTAQRTNRGLATTSAVLGYAGKPFETLANGEAKTVYGWQDLTFRKFPSLGWRALGNCDVPDLSLFPVRFPDVKAIRFQAGVELIFVHFILWMLTWLVRARVIKNLAAAAGPLLACSRLFDALGTANSGFFMELKGRDERDKPKKLLFELTARAGDGAMIPCIPAIVMALKLARGTARQRGAQPCVGLLTLDELLEGLKTLNVSWSVNETE